MREKLVIGVHCKDPKEVSKYLMIIGQKLGFKDIFKDCGALPYKEEIKFGEIDGPSAVLDYINKNYVQYKDLRMFSSWKDSRTSIWFLGFKFSCDSNEFGLIVDIDITDIITASEILYVDVHKIHAILIDNDKFDAVYDIDR